VNTNSRTDSRPAALASVAIVTGGAMWGLYWVPVRALGDMGLAGAWPGAAIFLAAALLLTPVVVLRARSLFARWRQLALCGLFTGTAISLFTSSLGFTEIVRAILLFYLMPVWGTLLGVAFLGERLSVHRVAALALGLAGLAVVLGFGDGLPLPRGPGEWMAFVSGIAWALGSTFLYRAGEIAVPEQLVAFVLGILVATGLTLFLGGDTFGAAPDRQTLLAIAPWALAGGLYALPTLFLTIWPATILTPGRIGLLLMSEVVVGVASAAFFAGEPFGPREAIGSALIVSAGFVEVLGKR